MAENAAEIVIRPQGQAEQTAEQTAEQAKKTAETLLTEVLLASPEDYVFKFNPETQVDEALVADFRRFAFEQKMSLENAQLMAKFYENHVRELAEKQSREQARLLQSMQKACEEDTEYGGMSFSDNMRYAKAAVLRFDDGSLAEILNETGFGSHPEVVRFMYRVGRALAEKICLKPKTCKKNAPPRNCFIPA